MEEAIQSRVMFFLFVIKPKILGCIEMLVMFARGRALEERKNILLARKLGQVSQKFQKVCSVSSPLF